MTRPQWLTVVASWPIEVRQSFGERFNALAEPGLANYLDAERRAFAEVSAQIEAGHFATPAAATSSTRLPRPGVAAPGQASMVFGGPTR